MKRLWFSIGVLFFAMQVHAQLHNKVLLVVDLDYHGTGPLLDAVSAYYHDSIEEVNYIPKDLSSYNAVLIQWNQAITDSASELSLIDYLKYGGKVYLEGTQYKLRVNGEPDTFMKYCGVSSPLPASAVEIRFRAIHAPDSEYTRGLDTAWTPKDPNFYDLTEPWGLDGNLVSLLCAQEDMFSECDPVAWRPVDTNVHTVIYWTIRPELYDKFIQRTLCNYFGLCEAAAVRRVATISISISPNPSHSDITISLPEDRESSVEIADVLGNVLLRKQAKGEMHWKPEHDVPAVYFVRVATRQADGTMSVSTQRVLFEL